MQKSFDSWTDYDSWLVENYDVFAVTSLNEVDGTVVAEYVDKAEWEKTHR